MQIFCDFCVHLALLGDDSPRNASDACLPTTADENGATLVFDDDYQQILLQLCSIEYRHLDLGKTTLFPHH